jgi:SAM-dependent methyltransferase
MSGLGERVRSLTFPPRYTEEFHLTRFLRRAREQGARTILDVGCGYGRYLGLAQQAGLVPTGVDVNPTHREHVKRLGLSCYSPEEAQALDARWDAMLMAHVIEHFSPAELLKLLDSYLDRLSERGFLVIATPTDWPRFLADFDHVRAYYPESLLQVFGDGASQLQYHARNRLALLDVGVRKHAGIPRDASLGEWRAQGIAARSFDMLRVGLARTAFVLTRGLAGGVTSGWVGLFQKVPSRSQGDHGG